MPPRHAVLGVENASFYYGATRVFEGLTLQLDDARTALVGENGAGKSTLLKCLTGELELNGGKLVRSRGLKVGYVPQETPEGLSELSVRDVLLRVLPIRDGSDDWKADVLVDEYGIPFEMTEQTFGTLSGGWQRLILIAAAARLAEPDLLILDEPTNYLDLSNINTLERWLELDAKLPMLIVSHDREFLERNTARTIFLRSDGAHSFDVPFGRAREALLHRDAADAVRRKLEEKEIKRLDAMAKRYAVWGQLNDAFHRKQKSTEKRIARLEAVKTESYRARERRLELHDGAFDAKVALRVEQVDVATPDARKLFHVDRLNIGVGERIAILGANGVGKSLLLSALADAWDPDMEHYDGSAPIRFNPATKLVHFDQRMRDLPLKQTLLAYVTAAEGVTEAEGVKLLAKAGFIYERIRQPISTLSHGERARLIFLKLRLMKPNLYLLDEPTNHLDIEGQEALEEQLEEADVTCLFVSHDRYFTRTAATRFLEVSRGRLVEVESAEAFFDAQ